MVERHDRPREWLTTEWYVRMVARWDAIMSSMDAKLSFEKDKPNKNKTLQDFLEEFMEMFAKIKFHSTKREMWGVQKVVILTTTSIICLKDKLFEEENGIKVFSPGKVLGNAVFILVAV